MAKNNPKMDLNNNDHNEDTTLRLECFGYSGHESNSREKNGKNVANDSSRLVLGLGPMPHSYSNGSDSVLSLGLSYHSNASKSVKKLFSNDLSVSSEIKNSFTLLKKSASGGYMPSLLLAPRINMALKSFPQKRAQKRKLGELEPESSVISDYSSGITSDYQKSSKKCKFSGCFKGSRGATGFPKYQVFVLAMVAGSGVSWEAALGVLTESSVCASLMAAANGVVFKVVITDLKAALCSVKPMVAENGVSLPVVVKGPKVLPRFVKLTGEENGVSIKEARFAPKVFIREPVSAWLTAVERDVGYQVAPRVPVAEPITALNTEAVNVANPSNAPKALKAAPTSAKLMEVDEDAFGAKNLNVKTWLKERQVYAPPMDPWLHPKELHRGSHHGSSMDLSMARVLVLDH